MSLSNLLAPNEEVLYIKTLNMTNSFSDNLLTKQIDTPLGSATLEIVPPGSNSLLVNIGNSSASTAIVGPLILPPGVAGAYIINSSGQELSGNTNLTGAIIQTNGGFYRIRKIGNWVDVYIYSLVAATVSVPGTVTIASFIPIGYRIPTNTGFAGIILSNGINVPAQYIINSDGSAIVGTMATGQFGAGVGGLISLSCSYTTI